MKHFLLVSAAALALLAAPIAGAQYSDPTPPTPPTVEQQNDPGAPIAPEDGVASQDAPYASSADTDFNDPADAYAAPRTQAQTESQTYAAAGADMSMSAAMTEHARDAGMDAIPMTAADVCAPRSVDFEQSRLNSDARRQLINAVDRASVCEMREVVIKAPESRAAAVRRELVSAGVDEAAITIEPAAAGELELDMTFAGVATSSEQYAAIFNPTQVASFEPDAEPAPMQDEGQYAPSSYDPYAPTGAPTYEPAPANAYDPNDTL